ncbi:MAG TPA: hypothetical protein VMF61_17000 [Candidatus Acidoferrales bacterium]|nr:hypothetical protein [Candidatus Acidoferrales bacterium]
MIDPGVPTVLLHIGTHKTGTTSIQATVAHNAAIFARAGILVPRSGLALTKGGNLQYGHHNLAWELNDIDALFDPRDGTMVQTLEEIAAAKARVAILSSEDFEWLHAKPAVLQRLASDFASIGYRVAVVLYLRRQPEYVQAIYVEGSKSGFLMNYNSVFREVVATGTFVPDPRVVNRFEYGPLAGAYAGAFGAENLIVRAYEGNRPQQALLREFVDLASNGAVQFEALAIPGALNASPDFVAVLSGMYRAVAARQPAAPSPQALIARRYPQGDPAFLQKFDVMLEPETRTLLERFAAGNRRIASEYGAHVPFETEGDLRPPGDPRWSSVVKQRAVLEDALESWGVG